jgi:hypothetical protein
MTFTNDLIAQLRTPTYTVEDISTMAEAASELESLERELATMTADRDSWRDQASQRVADWDAMRRERDEALVALERIRQDRAHVGIEIRREWMAKCAELQRERDVAVVDKKRLDAMVDESWELRCFTIPSYADDADVGWRVIQHHMQAPHERVIAEVFRDDPRAAIDAAIKSGSEG